MTSCSGRRARPAAHALDLLAQEPDDAQEVEHLARGATVDRLLRLVVREAGAGADHPAAHVDGGDLSSCGELDAPDDGRPFGVREEARCAFREDRRVQGRPPVRCVERHPPGARLLIDGASGDDEVRDVGDRVSDDESCGLALRCEPALDVDRLVEVHGAGWVDRHEGDVEELAIVGVGATRTTVGSPLRLEEHTGRKVVRYVHLVPQVGEGGPDPLRHGRPRKCNAQASGGHEPTLRPAQRACRAMS